MTLRDEIVYTTEPCECVRCADMLLPEWRDYYVLATLGDLSECVGYVRYPAHPDYTPEYAAEHRAAQAANGLAYKIGLRALDSEI